MPTYILRSNTFLDRSGLYSVLYPARIRLGKLINGEMKAGIKKELLKENLQALIKDNSLTEIADMFDTTANNVFEALSARMGANSYITVPKERPSKESSGAWSELKQSDIYREVLLGEKIIADVTKQNG